MNEDLTLEYGDGTEVRYGCAATLNNEFWYFGGGHHYRQVNCKNTHLICICSFFRLAKLLDASWNDKRT